MKVRRDFVSNSSSSSYIVAVDFSAYDLDLFVEKVCDKCGEPGTGRAAKAVRRANEEALRHGLTLECLYLGNPVVGKVSETWKRGEDYDHKPLRPGQTDEYTPFRELSASKGFSDGDSVTFIDKDTLVHEYDDELPAWVAVPRRIMAECIRKCDSFSVRDKSLAGNGPKARAKRVVAYVRQKAGERIRTPEPEVFCITANTVKNTRDLLAAGYKIRFGYPLASSAELMAKSLDALEARMKAGETFVFAVAGDSGEGVADGRLYMPYGYSNPFEYTPAQNVTRTFEEF